MIWTKDFFNTMYWEMFMKRSPAQVKAETDIIKSLSNPSEVMDVCCGVADIARQLELDLGIKATGIEYSPDYVQLSCIKDIIQGDACELQTDRKYSLVLNWFSSFAYFSPEQNKKLLQNCHTYCSDTFLLETYNSQYVVDNFKDCFLYQKEYLGEIYDIQRVARIEDNKLYQDWTFSTANKTYVHKTFSHLYYPHEIKELLQTIGFKNVQIHERDNYGARIILKAQV